MQNDGNFVIRKLSDNSVVTHTVGITNEISNLWSNVNDCLPLSGGANKRMSGSLYLANATWNHIGDDVVFGDQNVAGNMCLLGLNGETGITFFKYNDSSSGKKIWLDSSGKFNMNTNLLLYNQPNAVLFCDNNLGTTNKQVINTNATNIYLGNPEANTYLEGSGITVPISSICRGSVSGTTLTIYIG